MDRGVSVIWRERERDIYAHTHRRETDLIRTMENFGPNDVHNGTLTQMFRQAGIDDVRSYVDDVREESSLSTGTPGRSKNALGNVKQIYQLVSSSAEDPLMLECLLFSSNHWTRTATGRSPWRTWRFS